MLNPIEYRRFRLDVQNHKKERPILQSGNISYANWWREDPEKAWFTRFIRFYYPDSKVPVRFYSVFGPRSELRKSFDGVKIFYSGENLEEYRREGLVRNEGAVKALDERRRWYEDYGSGDVDLSLGFAQEISKVPMSRERPNRYLRFPLWIMCLFDPEDQKGDIRRKIDSINASREICQTGESLPNRPITAHGIACIASHDMFGTKAPVCDGIEAAGFLIQYAGRWRHSTDVLQQTYRDDKEAYLRCVRFNICPENTDTKDYVTEKLFEAFRAGVIPIYQGSLNVPEPEVIHRDAVLFWEHGRDNGAVFRIIREIESDDDAYVDFLRRPKIREGAEEIIWQYLSSLREELGRYLV